jgi:hypothetical protein
MTSFGMNIVRERLANQFLTGSPLAGPVEVVRALGAVQAQDYSGAKWAVGMRTRAATDADVEGAVARGEILRTHVLRPTWHFVLPEDIRWMLALTGPRISQALSSYNRKLGLTPAVFRKSHAAIEKALREGKHLLRSELRPLVEKARGVPTNGQVIGHMMLQAEIDGLICSGACRGKQFTYALLDERVPAASAIDRDEALSRLAERYFATRGPASASDFAWWSGLTVGDAKRAIEIRGSKLTPVTVGETRMWMVERSKPAPSPTGSAHLLPNYDEYFIGYRDRSAIGRRLRGVELVTGGDSRITHVVIVNGELVGGWRRSPDGKPMISISPKARLTSDERILIDEQRARFERFTSR